MKVDPSQFHPVSITDTCSVWKVLSSERLYNAAIGAKCVFACTGCVVYECLHKRRKAVTPEDTDLQGRLKREQQAGRFRTFSPSLEDLQHPHILAIRDRLGRGELSVLALALCTGQAVMTDDPKARTLAEQVVALDRVQTTPQLFGWLLFHNHLSDGDKDTVIHQHEEVRPRPLTRFLEDVYLWALECRLSASAADRIRRNPD